MLSTVPCSSDVGHQAPALGASIVPAQLSLVSPGGWWLAIHTVGPMRERNPILTFSSYRWSLSTVDRAGLLVPLNPSVAGWSLSCANKEPPVQQLQ